MAGTMAEKAADGGSKDDPPYPGESPTDAEFDEWLKKFQNALRGTDYAAMLADEIPASLIGFSANVDTSDLHEQLAVAGETVAEARARQMHNHKVKSAKRDEQARKDAYDAGMKKLKNGLAGRISGMMTAGHALGVLSSLKIQFKMGSDTDGVPQYDGYKMFKDIIGTRAAKSAPSKRREGQWHEREYQKMLAEPLPDHCVVAEYSKKIVKLREQLMPFFRTVKLEKETLSEVFVQLMPACNQGEGRTLEREITDAQRHKLRTRRVPPPHAHVAILTAREHRRPIRRLQAIRLAHAVNGPAVGITIRTDERAICHAEGMQRAARRTDDGHPTHKADCQLGGGSLPAWQQKACLTRSLAHTGCGEGRRVA
mgnify:CR=1 FL=1